MSLFSDSASSPKPLGPVRSARLPEIKAGVQALCTVGGTNLSVGQCLLGVGREWWVLSDGMVAEEGRMCVQRAGDSQDTTPCPLRAPRQAQA